MPSVNVDLLPDRQISPTRSITCHLHDSGNRLHLIPCKWKQFETTILGKSSQSPHSCLSHGSCRQSVHASPQLSARLLSERAGAHDLASSRERSSSISLLR
eukprot:3987416-Karenia_brevis.AAC.1